MPRFSRTMSLTVGGETCSSTANRYAEIPIGSRNSSRRISPGCTAQPAGPSFLMLMISFPSGDLLFSSYPEREILIVWDGHSRPSPLIVILRKRSRAQSERLPTKDLCNSLLGLQNLGPQ